VPEQNLKGVVFASAKKTFFAGGDLNDLLKVERADEATFAMVERNKAPYRELEKTAGAGRRRHQRRCAGRRLRALPGLQPSNRGRCAACRGRPAEVTLGLLPGAGGVVRLTALIGLEKALPLLLEGKQLRPAEALKQGLVDEIVAHPGRTGAGRQGLDQGQHGSAHATVGPEGLQVPPEAARWRPTSARSPRSHR